MGELIGARETRKILKKKIVQCDKHIQFLMCKLQEAVVNESEIDQDIPIEEDFGEHWLERYK